MVVFHFFAGYNRFRTWRASSPDRFRASCTHEKRSICWLRSESLWVSWPVTCYDNEMKVDEWCCRIHSQDLLGPPPTPPPLMVVFHFFAGYNRFRTWRASSPDRFRASCTHEKRSICWLRSESLWVSYIYIYIFSEAKNIRRFHWCYW